MVDRCRDRRFVSHGFCGRHGDGRPGLALVELSVVEPRYRAVLEAAAGVPVTEVAGQYEVSRQSVPTPGLPGPRSNCEAACPGRRLTIEAAVPLRARGLP
jgi:hypothetical protein